MGRSEFFTGQVSPACMSRKTISSVALRPWLFRAQCRLLMELLFVMTLRLQELLAQRGAATYKLKPKHNIVDAPKGS